jgi:hypothetical protein
VQIVIRRKEKRLTEKRPRRPLSAMMCVTYTMGSKIFEREKYREIYRLSWKAGETR